MITESLLMQLDHKKFWLKSIWVGSIQFEDRPKSGVLFFYKNNEILNFSYIIRFLRVKVNIERNL